MGKIKKEWLKRWTAKKYHALTCLVLFGILVGSTVFLPLVSIASGPTIYAEGAKLVKVSKKDGDYKKIKDAIKYAPSGAIIDVEEGYYPDDIWDVHIGGGRLLKSQNRNQLIRFGHEDVNFIVSKKGEGEVVFGCAVLSAKWLPRFSVEEIEPTLFFDVYLDSAVGVDSLEVIGSLSSERLNGYNDYVLFWYDGQGWRECSNYEIDRNTNSIIVWFDAHSYPSLSELAGTRFGIGGTSPASTTVGLMARLLPLLLVAVLVVFLVVSLYSGNVAGIVIAAVAIVIILAFVQVISAALSELGM